MTEKNEIAEKNKFRLFYLEAIMHDSSFPQIHSIKPIFEDMTLEDFIDFVNRVLESNDYELTQQFLYFLILFRDMPHLQRFMNSSDFNIEILEKLIIFTYGYCSLHDHSTERIIDEILYFLSNERLLELVQSSQHIANDKLLLYFILSKFDVDMLNAYFASIKNIKEFSATFFNLPDEVLRSIIARNYHLFQYIMLMIAESGGDQMVSDEFYNRYKHDIELFSKLNDIIRQYKDKVDYESEKSLPFNKRDMGRISFLVNTIKDFPDAEKAVEYFSTEKVFMDEEEKMVVLAIASDPLLKDTFKYYDTMFEL
jgi:hypothetical protein